MQLKLNLTSFSGLILIIDYLQEHCSDFNTIYTVSVNSLLKSRDATVF